MTISAKKIAIGAMVALSLGAASTTPASAWCNGWGCGGGGMNPGAAAALGALGGVAVGAAIANSARPPAYYYEAPPPAECWLERRPVYDSWGNYLGRRRVRVCE